MIGPSTAAEPRIANTARSQRVVLKLRWVNSRWNPTVTPKPARATVVANTIRSCQCSALPHTCHAIPASPSAGRNVAVAFATWSSLSPGLVNSVWRTTHLFLRSARSAAKRPAGRLASGICGLERPYVDRFGPLVAALRVELDLCPLGQRSVALADDAAV